MNCFLCKQPIVGSQWTQEHHPDRENEPDRTETVHTACHTTYHTRNGDFAKWGKLSSGAGQKGYKHAIEKEPQLHRLGGLARSRTAARTETGQFAKGATS